MTFREPANLHTQTLDRTCRAGRFVGRRWVAAIVLTLSVAACGSDAADPKRATDSDSESDNGEGDDGSEGESGEGESSQGEQRDGGASDAGTAPRRDGSVMDASAGSRDGGPLGTGNIPPQEGGASSESDAASGGGSGGGCTRETLKTTIDAYFAALAAHDPAPLARAQNVKFTENAKVLQLGEGLWKTAGAAKFQRSLLDSERCGSLTQAVIDEAGKEILFAVRLKLENQEITEVETFVVKSGLFFQPSGVKDDGGADWEGLLAADERSTREQLNAVADAYFESFTDTSVEVPYDTPCKRFEGGLMPVAHCSEGFPANTQITDRRYPVADVEAGIAVGFVLFGGNLLDFHMFKIRNGKITGIQALVGPRAESSGWDEP